MTDSKRDFLYQFIGNKIIRHLASIKLKQVDLARKLGTTPATLSNILSGKRQISLHLLFEIAEILEIDTSYFIPSFEEIDTSEKNSQNLMTEIFQKTGISNKTQETIMNFLNQSKDLK